MTHFNPDFIHWFLSILFPSLPLGVLFALGLNFLLYWFIFRSKLGRKILSGREHYDHVHTRHELLTEMKRALIPESMLSVITTLLLTSRQPSPIQHLFSVRWDMTSSEIPRILVEVLFLLLAYEVYYFIVHYAIHNKKIYKYFHRTHHLSIYPTPQSGTSVDILEALVFYTFFFTIIWGPFHIMSLAIIGLEIKLASLSQHMGHEIVPQWVRRSNILKYFNSTRFHQLHHSDRVNRNYGFQTNLFDRLFGTINPIYVKYEKEE